MKYAIVEHGGKQYLAQEGGLIEVDRMVLEVGKPVVFKDVLLVSDGKAVKVGAPFVSGATVKGKVLAHPKGKKVVVFKYKPKQRYRRKQGHRQLLTHVSVESIGVRASKPKAKTQSKGKKTTRASSKREGASSKASTAKKTKSTAKKSETKSKKK